MNSWQRPRLAVDEIVHHNEVADAAGAQIGAGRAQGGVAAGDDHTGDDSRVEHGADEREALGAALGGGLEVRDPDTGRVEILDARGARPIDIREDDAEALGETVGRRARELESTSTWFEPTAMNSFFGENALNWSPRPALTEAKAVLSTRRPVPGVDITTPRFELTLKKVAGKLSTLVTAAGTPSQLISRRPLSAGGVLGAFSGPPSAARKASRLSAIVKVSPSARNVVKAGGGGGE